MSVAIILITNRLMGEYDPAVFVSHLLGLLIELLFFRWEYLRNRKTSLLGLLLEDLLLVFKSKQFSIVIKHRLKEISILR